MQTRTPVIPSACDRQAPDETSAPQPPDDDLVQLNVNELIVGRRLRFPIYDAHGVLLLAEGSVITSTFKQLLTARQMGRLLCAREGARAVTLGEPAAGTDAADRSSAISGIGSELAAKLDALLGPDALVVDNTGPAVRDEQVVHGRRGYNRAQRERLVREHRQRGEQIDEMMLSTLRGGRVDAGRMAALTGGFLSDLVSDGDHVLAVAAEAGHDSALSEHCLQMSLLGMALGIEMGLCAEHVRTIGLAGLVHDWGMLRVAEDIRDAGRKLTSSEFLAVKRHPIYSLEMLERVAGLPGAVPLTCYQVHERPNGSGYPRGRRGNAIHLFARILHVADAFLAMTSRRAYRPPLMAYSAVECLLRQVRQKHMDPDVVRALLRVMSMFPIGSHVVLSDGSVARVLRRNGDNYAAPIVQRLQDRDGRPADPDDEINILDLSQCGLTVEHALPTPGRDEIALNTEVLTHSWR